jgi:hypothetical protein
VVMLWTRRGRDMARDVFHCHSMSWAPIALARIEALRPTHARRLMTNVPRVPRDIGLTRPRTTAPGTNSLG